MKRALLTISVLLSVLLLPRGALAGERFVLRASPESIGQVCADHGLRVVREIGRRHLVLVESDGSVAPEALAAAIQADARVYDFEPARRRRALSDPAPAATQAAAPEPIDRTPTEFYGASAWTGYVMQPAALRVGADLARAAGGTGAGVLVAVIDTGIDPDHPILSGAVTPGYDFLTDAPGGWPVLETDQSSQPILKQSSQPIVKQSSQPIVKQSSQPILKQSSQPILKDSDAATFASHGTLVAGLVRLIAPEARIMSLRAFASDGTATNADVIEAIYYAVDHGARVINMSFSSDSREVKRAIQYATNRGVVCVAAAGNDGERTLVFPAALNRVLGVASTTLDDVRASFSNYGAQLVSVAAPGENLLTTYPGGLYALVSGTSFSTALVSGAAAILAGAQPGMDYSDAEDAFRYSVFLGRDLGYGRIDIPSALAAAQAQVWATPRRWLAPAKEDRP